MTADSMPVTPAAAVWALQAYDPEVGGLLAREHQRDRATVRLIASENYSSSAVRAAVGDRVMERYATGRPGDRRYPACGVIDELERLAADRATALFGASHANVQLSSGSIANLCAILSAASPGARLLAPGSSAGGHVSQGADDHLSGHLFSVARYGVDPTTDLLDLDLISSQAKTHRPALLVAGATNYPRAIDHEGLARIASDCGARLLVDVAHTAGLIAGGGYPDPVPHADLVTLSTHKTLRGPRGGIILARAELADDVDRAVFPRVQGGPDVARTAAVAVALREAGSEQFRGDIDRALRTARTLAAALSFAGLRILTGGTDTHMVLVDLRSTGLSATEAQDLCEREGLLVNGVRLVRGGGLAEVQALRLGTAATATLGVEEQEMGELGASIGRLLLGPDDPQARRRVRAAVTGLRDRRHRDDQRSASRSD